MIKSDFAKERFGITTRIAFALFALWVLIVGGMLGLAVEGDQTLVPGLSITFAQLGVIGSVGVGLGLLFVIRLGYKYFRNLERLETEEAKQ